MEDCLLLFHSSSHLSFAPSLLFSLGEANYLKSSATPLLTSSFFTTLGSGENTVKKIWETSSSMVNMELDSKDGKPRMETIA